MKLSDYIVSYYENLGITDAFIVTGGSAMHLNDSFFRSNKIHIWPMHTEQSASFAADAYSKMKNKPCIVMTTSGPAVTNLTTGILTSFQDSIGVIYLSGQSSSRNSMEFKKSTGLRQLGIQEVNGIEILKSITKYCRELDDPSNIFNLLSESYQEMISGRKGPVFLSIPIDFQSVDIEINLGFYKDGISFSKYEINKQLQYDERIITTLIEQLYLSKRPVFLAGHGVRLSDSLNELEMLSHRLDIPIVSTYLGIDSINDSFANKIGSVGIKGTRAGNLTIQNADLIIVLGSSMHISQTGYEYDKFAPNAKIIIIDVDKKVHNKLTFLNTTTIIESNLKNVLLNLLDKSLDYKSDSEWILMTREWREKYPLLLPEHNEDKFGINTYKLIDVLNSRKLENTVFLADSGFSYYVVSQSLKIYKNSRYILPSATATMGYVIPAIVGVFASNEFSLQIVIVGDGSFMHNFQEIIQISKLNVNAKIFIINNNGLLSIRQTQERYFNNRKFAESPSTGLFFPKFKKLADTFDIPFYTFSKILDLEERISLILGMSGPAIIEIISPDFEIKPNIISILGKDGKFVSQSLEDMYPPVDL